MPKLSLKHWAIILTVAALLLVIVSNAIGEAPIVVALGQVILFVAIVFWVIILVRWRRSKPKPTGRVRTVGVVFTPLHRTPRPGATVYTYLWTIPRDPQTGDRVIVPGSEEPSPAVVVDVDPVPDPDLELVAVTRLVPQREVDAAVQEVEGRRDLWLSMVRHAAGIPGAEFVPAEPVDGYPNIAPLSGSASVEDADRFGKMWWRAYRIAQELNLDPAEVSTYKNAGHRWFAVRDRGANG